MVHTRSGRAVPRVESDSDSDAESASSDSVRIIIKQPKLPMFAGPYGAGLWFDMCKETGREMQCSICLDSCLHCRDCMVLLLPCFHVLHYKCMCALAHPECPICRPSNK